MRVATVLLALASLCVALPARADGGLLFSTRQQPELQEATQESGAVFVTIDLRATLHDGIYVCIDDEFPVDENGSSSEAIILASSVAGALGVANPRYEFDEFLPDCVGIEPDRALSVANGQPNERIFRLDTTMLAGAMSDAGYDDLFVDVCFPILPAFISPAGIGIEAEPGFCEFRGYSFEGEAVAEILFHARFVDFLRGTASMVAAFLLLLVLGGLVAATAVRGILSWMASRPVFTWIVIGLSSSFLALLWPAAAFASGFVHATELYRGLGPGFEVAFLLPTTVIVGSAVALAGLLARRRIRSRNADLLHDPGGTLEPFELDPRATSRGIRSVVIAYLFVLVAGSIAALASPLQQKTSAVLGAAIAAALGLPLLVSLIYSLAYRPAPLNDPDREREILNALRSLGLRAHAVRVTRSPLYVVRLGPYRPAGPYAAGVLGFRSAIVWDHALDMPADWIAAGLAQRRLGPEGFWPALLLTSAALIVRSSNSESLWWPFLAPLGAMAVMDGLAYGSRLLARRRAERDPVAFRSGTLMFGRIEARLLAPRNLGSRLGTWRRAWLDARLKARRLDSGDDIAALENEIVRAEYRRFATRSSG